MKQMIGAMVLGLALVAAGPATARAQGESQTPSIGGYEPRVGQPGKDVVWVPTPQSLVELMLDVAEVTGDDYLIDLGSGDGRTVITAARRGARAHGIEFNEDMVKLAQAAAEREGVAERATFEQADLFTRLDELQKADVITMFLLSSLNLKLRPTLLELEPGTRIVSNTFRMADWEPDVEQRIEGDCASWCEALLWIVPAKVEGTWQMGDTTLSFSQQFQRVGGARGAQVLTDVRIRGRELSFVAGDVRYTGTVEGDTITGTREDGSTWSARRQPATP